MSGHYEDDLDNCDDIVYTGQGGNDLLGNKRQKKDQVMTLGNLGLKVRTFMFLLFGLFSSLFVFVHCNMGTYFVCKLLQLRML